MDANAENECDSGGWRFPSYSVRANALGARPKADSDPGGLDRGMQC